MSNHYHQQIDDLLAREITRSEFLKYIGIALLGTVGFTGFLKNLHQSVTTRSEYKTRVSHGYGRNVYGK